MDRHKVIELAETKLPNVTEYFGFRLAVEFLDEATPVLNYYDSETKSNSQMPNTHSVPFERCFFTTHHFYRGFVPSHGIQYIETWIPSELLNTDPDGVCCAEDFIKIPKLRKYIPDGWRGDG